MTTPLTSWLAASLARFEIPDPATAPLNLPLAFNQVFGLDFTGTQMVDELAREVLAASSGKVFLSPTPAPLDGQRSGAYLRLTGQRMLLINSGAPYVEWSD